MTTYTKPSEAELREQLSPLQYEVTQHEGTERPFANEYWNNKKAGIYVDVASGEPLFSSLDKYKSGTGWPSFTRPLESENVKTHTDYKLFMARTEVRSKHAEFPPRSRLRRWSRTHRLALLYELCFAAIYSGRPSRGRRLRPIFISVQGGCEGEVRPLG